MDAEILTTLFVSLKNRLEVQIKLEADVCKVFRLFTVGLNISYNISLRPPVYTRSNRLPQVCVDLLLFYASQSI